MYSSEKTQTVSPLVECIQVKQQVTSSRTILFCPTLWLDWWLVFWSRCWSRAHPPPPRLLSAWSRLAVSMTPALPKHIWRWSREVEEMVNKIVLWQYWQSSWPSPSSWAPTSAPRSPTRWLPWHRLVNAAPFEGDHFLKFNILVRTFNEKWLVS